MELAKQLTVAILEIVLMARFILYSSFQLKIKHLQVFQACIK